MKNTGYVLLRERERERERERQTVGNERMTHSSIQLLTQLAGLCPKVCASGTAPCVGMHVCVCACECVCLCVCVSCVCLFVRSERLVKCESIFFCPAIEAYIF